MTLDIRPFPRPEWSPLPARTGVEGKVLVRDGGFFVAMLRFSAQATIHEHPGETDTIVICIDGSGFTSVGEEKPHRSPPGSSSAGPGASRTASGPRARR